MHYYVVTVAHNEPFPCSGLADPLGILTTALLPAASTELLWTRHDDLQRRKGLGAASWS